MKTKPYLLLFLLIIILIFILGVRYGQRVCLPSPTALPTEASVKVGPISPTLPEIKKDASPSPTLFNLKNEKN